MKHYKFDIITETLTISHAFEQKLVKRESDEYRLYRQLREDHPNLKLARRTHATPKVYHASTGDVCKGNPTGDLLMNPWNGSYVPCRNIKHTWKNSRSQKNLRQPLANARIHWLDSGFRPSSRTIAKIP